LAHRRLDAGGAFGGLDTEAYGKLNPNRRIPTIEDDGVVIWESHACVRYLAARYNSGGLWPEDLVARAQADMWMDWLHTTLLAPLGVVFWGLIRTPEPARDVAAIAKATDELAELWPRLDAWLQDRSFIAGERLTIGDMPLGTACYRYYNLPIARPTLPAVEAWYQRLQDRAAYAEHVMLPVT
jgi:glutathione S-transferase